MTPFPRPEYRALEPYRPDRRPVPIDLSDNTNLRGPHPAAKTAVRGAGAEDLARYPSVYANDFVEQVARRFGVPRESVTTGCGSDDLLDSLFRAVAEPGEGISFLDPTFSMTPVFARMNAAVPMPTPGIPLPDPEALLRGGPALVYLCSPNNPTGESLPSDWVERLLAAVRALRSSGPVVVLDEAYADYAQESWIERAPEIPRLVVIRTLSKAYGLAGLRAGFAVGDPKVVVELEKSRGPYKVSRIAERAAVAALGDPSGWVEKGIAEVLRARDKVARALADLGHAPLESQANFLLVPVPNAAATTAALRARGIAVRPFPGVPGLGDAIRVSVGRWDYMQPFLEAMADLKGGGP